MDNPMAAGMSLAGIKVLEFCEVAAGPAAGNNNLWGLVCDVVDRDDLREDARFVDPTQRAANQHELKDMLEEIFATNTVAHWLASFAARGCACKPNKYV